MRFFAGLILLFASAAAAQQYRAFWADAFHPGFKTPSEVEVFLAEVKAARGNAVFVQMRRRGDVYFPHSVEPPAFDPDWSPSFDALDYLVRRAHELAIEVHAWAAVGPAWRDALGAPPDPRHVWNLHGPNALSDEMWLTVNDSGETAMRLKQGAEASYSLDLGHPAAARYLADVILEPLKRYDLDGIHLDYIRYPEYPGDWGRNPVSVERFQRLFNRIGSPDVADPRWSEFRRNQVTALVRQIYLRAHAMKPRVKVSAAVITWGDGPEGPDGFYKTPAYNRVYQDWPSWLAEGILDLAVPMNYFRESSAAAQLDRWLEFEKDNQYGRAVVPGLGVYLNSPAQSVSQVRRVLAPSAAGNRAAGVNFYNYASSGDIGRRVAAAFPPPGLPPSLPWLERSSKANVYGWLTVAPGPPWLADGAEIRVESATGGASIRTSVDATGFFGAAGLPPGPYRITVLRGGREVFRTAPRELAAGDSALFHLFLKESDFDDALPRVTRARVSNGALVIEGRALAGDPDPGEVLVLLDGVPVPAGFITPQRLECAVTPPGGAVVIVRRAGMESVPCAVAAD